mmetsp:Transcript_10079/g.30729  ORF Transcript_10079/g.30729 Transcript_10079/m.30729 type:complete len:205 (+) Transcript_10079:1294-1908(+)
MPTSAPRPCRPTPACARLGQTPREPWERRSGFSRSSTSRACRSTAWPPRLWCHWPSTSACTTGRWRYWGRFARGPRAESACHRSPSRWRRTRAPSGGTWRAPRPSWKGSGSPRTSCRTTSWDPLSSTPSARPGTSSQASRSWSSSWTGASSQTATVSPGCCMPAPATASPCSPSSSTPWRRTRGPLPTTLPLPECGAAPCSTHS